VGLGIDFTARDLQREAIAKGLPWEMCKGFDRSAGLSNEFVPLEELGGNIQDLHFEMTLNGEVRQSGWTGDMIFSVDRIISYVSQFFTLKTGDLIFTGTPVGVGAVHENQLLEGFVEDRKLLELKVK
jgi:2-keto-4-pentenoate hydratase/2-oxohepta-3-ene-1,7-dioic acid hydratase in catechol pathway